MTPGEVKAGRDFDPVEACVFLDPAIAGQPQDRPFYFDPFDAYYRVNFITNPTEGAPMSLAAVSLSEWCTFLGKSVDPALWSQVIEKASINDLEAVIARLRGEPGPEVPASFSPLLSYPDTQRLTESLTYLVLAKEIDPLSVESQNRRGWWTPPTANEIEAKHLRREEAVWPLAANIERALSTVRTPFIRQRYAYQAVRLRFYGGNRGECVDAFLAHQKDIGTTGSPAWRALSYVAGAHYQAKRYTEANLLYARIFDNFAPLRTSAYWSFHPQDEADWRLALDRASTTRERSVLWQLLGITHDGPRAMREIYKLDPQSDLLPLLVLREANRIEYEIDYRSARRTPPAIAVKTADVRAFIESRAIEGGVASPAVWLVAAAHLNAMLGDKDKADLLLAKTAALGALGPAMDRQIRLTRLYANINAMKVIDHEQEPILARELSWVQDHADKEDDTRLRALFAWSRATLANVYGANHDYISEACLDGEATTAYETVSGINDLISLLDKPEKTPFEDFLCRSYSGSRDDLVEIKALMALYDGDIHTAASRIAGLRTSVLWADPFSSRINDCHDCDAGDKSQWEYTKAAFVERLDKRLRSAESGAPSAAQDWFEVGNGLYNITCYGNASDMYADLMPQFAPREAGQSHRNSLPGQMERAEECYRKAYDASNDPEFRAKAAFMAAKCEQNIYFNRRGETDPDFRAGKWFRLLHESYADTRYVAEVIRECGYFRTYMGKSGGLRR